MTIEIRHLRAFLAVHDAGSMSAAAPFLGISQPSVTRLLGQLEAHLGTALATRKARGTTVTQVGERLVPVARQAVDAFDRALSDVGGEAVVRIGYAWSALIPVVERILHSWRQFTDQPTVELLRRPDPLSALTTQACHFALVRDWEPRDGFDRLDVSVEPRAAVVASTHPLARRSLLHLDDLAEYGLVTNSRGGTTPPDLWGHRHNRQLDRTTSDAEDWLTAIATDPAVFGMTPVSTADLYQHPAVSYIPLVDAPRVTSTLVWTRGDPSVSAFVIHVRTLLGDQPGTSTGSP